MSQPQQTHPPRRALVVIDVQNEYFPGGALPIEHPPIDCTLPNVLRAMDAATQAGIPVVIVQHTSPAGAPAFDKGRPGWELHPEVARRPRNHHIEKTQASVFTRTDFADWLSRHEIDTLTIVGYMTHNCDAATVFEAAHLGLHAELLSDASGSLPYTNDAGHASAEEIHRVFSVVLHTGFAAVAPTAAWIDALRWGERLPMDNVVMSNLRGREAKART